MDERARAGRLISQYALDWFTGAVIQSERILDREAYFRKCATGDIRETLESAHRTDCQLYVFALNQTSMALRAMLEAAPPAARQDIEDAIREFDLKHPNVKNLRDAFAHFDEYVAGGGRQQRTTSAPQFRVGFHWCNGDPRHIMEIHVHIGRDLPPLSIDVVASIADLTDLMTKIGAALARPPACPCCGGQMHRVQCVKSADA